MIDIIVAALSQARRWSQLGRSPHATSAYRYFVAPRAKERPHANDAVLVAEGGHIVQVPHRDFGVDRQMVTDGLEPHLRGSG